MILRLALAAMMFAAAPTIGATSVAAATDKGKAERSEKKAGKRSSREDGMRTRARSGDKTANRSGKDSNRGNTAKSARSHSTRTATAAKPVRRMPVKTNIHKYRSNYRNHPNPRGKHGQRIERDYGFKHLYGLYFGTRSANRKCTAAAKRRGGRGERIWGVSGKKYGSYACKRAMRECRRELRIRQMRGRDRHARCVIASRG